MGLALVFGSAQADLDACVEPQELFNCKEAPRVSLFRKALSMCIK